MELPLYQIDAFANHVFEGNPAAVCPLSEWLPVELMQNIAQENNLAETAFFVPTTEGFCIRWFTPLKEVDLCGHATLASAYVLFSILNYDQPEILFDSKSGILRVKRMNDMLEMDFPAQTPSVCECPSQLIEAFGQPLECLKAEDYLLVFEDEKMILEAKPDFSLLSEVDLRGVAITARSKKYDFVARVFAPKYGINEDPVTGSVYTQLVPYWSEKLNKLDLHARQVSSRGGEVFCSMAGDRVKISGKAVKYMEAKISI
ncbi:MAG: PhzF family phenazine biosynthesis protein [Gammaproteobacteria bacterium]|nr:PhzF family phenazine biosynthesis protein [Gammaproteobacteria bacterium]